VETLLALVDNSPDVIARYDREHRLRFMNATAERAFGHPRAALIGRPMGELPIPPALREAWDGGLRHVFESGQPADGEFELPAPGDAGGGGGSRYFQARLTPERDADGAVVSVLVTTRDLTDQRRAEAEARTAAALLHALFEQVSVGIAVARIEDGRFVRVNAAAAAIFGYTVDELLGATIGDLTQPEEAPAYRERTARVAAGELASYTQEGRYRRKDGSDVWARVSVCALRDAAGRPTHFVGVAQDVTEWKRAEEAQRRRERLLHEGERLAGFGTFEWHVGSDDATWSDEVYRIFGRDPRHPAPLHTIFLESVHPDDRARVFAALDDAVAHRGSYDVQFRIVRPDGAARLVRERASVETGPGGEAVRVVGVTQDVTERAEAERALRESEERFRALVEHASDLIAILDLDGSNRYASPSHEAVLGVTPAELRGRNALELVHPGDLEKARRALDRVVTGPGPVGPEPLRFRHRDGSWRTLLVTLADLRAAPGVGGIVANSRDVTRQLALEERLRQSQKLEALGQLAGGVAHDFNNVLAAIVGYGQMVVDALPPGDARREDAEQVVLAAERGTDLTRQLLAFSRRGAAETEVIDLAAVARDTARMLRPLLPASIALVAPPDDAPPVPVRAARAPVEQIVLNLAVNARDAMPDGGTLTIAVRTDEPPHPGVPGMAPTARLVVRDTGVGIPPEVRARIFEPFFTTKPNGRGTGLGLATVYGLTDQFGGTVEVESEVGRGTTFTVTLPLATAAELPAPQPPAAPVPPDRSRGPGPSVETPGPAARPRVLVVEDEAPIRTIARRALEGAGYDVVLESDGARALARLRTGEPFDLVLTDAAMPEVSGWRLAAEAAEARPALPVVLMSGYAELTDGRRAAVGVADYLEKPFSMRHLVDVVSRALASRG
jgi:PAS domain S-box-containing protein